MRQETPIPRFAIGLVALVLLAFALRVHGLDSQSLWVDEATTVSRSQQPLLQLLRTMPPEHAPLYFVVIHFWLAIAGATDFALRFPSVFFGVLCVPLIGQLGASLFRRRVGWLAALLLAVNPFHVWHAQDARMYTLATALSLACLTALVRALRDRPRDRQLRPWAIYSIAGALAIYSHYYAGLIVLASGMYVLAWLVVNPAGRREIGRRWLSSVAAMTLLLLPWLPHARRVLAFHGYAQSVDAASLIRSYLTAYSVGTSVPGDLGWRLTWGILALAGIGLAAALSRSRRDPAYRRGTSLVLAVLLTAILGGVLLAVRRSQFFDRYFIMFTPAYLLSAALGIQVLARPRRAPIAALAAVAFVLGASAYSLRNHYADPHFGHRDHKAVVAQIARWADPEWDAIVLNGIRESEIKRYYMGERPSVYNLQGSRYEGQDDAGRERMLTEIVQRHRQVWVLVEAMPDTAIAWFDRSGYAYPVESGWTTDIFVARYATLQEHLARIWRPRSTRETGPVHLAGAYLASATPFGGTRPAPLAPPGAYQHPAPDALDTERRSTTPGEVIRLTLMWQTDAVPDTDLKVSLRLTDAYDNVVAAVDRPAGDGSGSSSWPPHTAVSDNHGLQVPPDITTGEYYLVVKLYDPATLIDVEDAVLGPVEITDSP